MATGDRARQHDQVEILDPLDAMNYDPMESLCQVFASTSAFGSVADVQTNLHLYALGLDDKLEELRAAQADAQSSVQRVAGAHAELSEIFDNIETVRQRAVVAENVITAMTADIRKLDDTKRNLTASMTVLKRLQMLTTAFDQLSLLLKNREYKDASQLLSAVMELVAYFKPYRSIAQIAALSKDVAILQTSIADQVSADFEASVEGKNGEFLSERPSVLHDACLVLDALGEMYKTRQTTWYCNVQLREYRRIFRGSEEAGSLDNISRRYSYLKRMLVGLQPQIERIFPPHWAVLEALCQQFCETTRDDYKLNLSQSGKAIDVDLLLRAMEETMDFEQYLEQKFSTSQVRASMDSTTDVSESSSTVSIFGRSISSAFEPYLGLWVDSQDRKLFALVSQYSNQMMIATADDGSPHQVLPSSVDLFLSYRKYLAQCAKISTGKQLFSLAKTFQKYLQQYADRVLSTHIPEKVVTEQDVQNTCLIIATANYCHTTGEQLEKRIISVIDDEYKTQINFEAEKDKFLNVASNAIQSLVGKVESDTKPAWREMLNTNWAKLSAVGDQSNYVTELIKAIETDVAVVTKYSPKDIFVRSFCNRVVESTINSYLPNIAKCKPLTEICSEQMLLDCYVLKKSLTRLPVYGAPADVQPPTSYINLVNRVTGRLEAVLKAILTNQPDSLPDNLKVYLPSTNIVKRALNTEKFRW
ncbi:Vps53-like protein [Lipomyces oligophaga]|uniref:Vps53-like protein n=1 Tax=Lipomyces oligophaga TaxID=45792 RepID=UPI0034CD94B5